MAVSTDSTGNKGFKYFILYDESVRAATNIYFNQLINYLASNRLFEFKNLNILQIFYLIN